MSTEPEKPASTANPAGQGDVTCSRCHAEQFTVVDEKTGLLRCDYCRNQWIDSRFIKLTETERFLREQAARPQIVTDNTSDTDRQLMQMLTGLVSFNPLRQLQGCLYRFARTLTIIFIVVLLMIIAGFVALHIDWGALSSGQGLIWR